MNHNNLNDNNVLNRYGRRGCGSWSSGSRKVSRQMTVTHITIQTSEKKNEENEHFSMKVFLISELMLYIEFS